MSNDIHKFLLLPKKESAVSESPLYYASMLVAVIENPLLHMSQEVRNEIINLINQVSELESVNSDNVAYYINYLIGLLTPEASEDDIADVIMLIWREAGYESYRALTDNSGIIFNEQYYNIASDDEDNDIEIHAVFDINYNVVDIKQLVVEQSIDYSTKINDTEIESLLDFSCLARMISEPVKSFIDLLPSEI